METPKEEVVETPKETPEETENINVSGLEEHLGIMPIAELGLDDFDLDDDEEDDEDPMEEIEDGTWGTIWHKKSTDQYFNEDGDELVKEDGEFVEKE